jgi:hypothetical protein
VVKWVNTSIEAGIKSSSVGSTKLYIILKIDGHLPSGMDPVILFKQRLLLLGKVSHGSMALQ